MCIRDSISAAREHPVELGMLLYVGLNEYHGFFGVDAAGQQQRDRIKRALPELIRILPDGGGMQVGHAIIAETVIRLQKRPVAQRAHIVAERRRAGGPVSYTHLKETAPRKKTSSSTARSGGGTARKVSSGVQAGRTAKPQTQKMCIRDRHSPAARLAQRMYRLRGALKAELEREGIVL